MLLLFILLLILFLILIFILLLISALDELDRKRGRESFFAAAAFSRFAE